MKECIIAMQTNTAAQKAARAVRNSGYEADIVSVEPSLTKRGCSYGIRVVTLDAERVVRILDSKGITHGEVLGERI